MNVKNPVYILPDEKAEKPPELPIIIGDSPPKPPLHRYTCYICGAWVLTEQEIKTHFRTHWHKSGETEI